MLETIKKKAQERLTDHLVNNLMKPLDRLLGTSLASFCNVVTATAETAEAKITSESSRFIKLLESKKGAAAEPKRTENSDGSNHKEDGNKQEETEEQLTFTFTSS